MAQQKKIAVAKYNLGFKTLLSKAATETELITSKDISTSI